MRAVLLSDVEVASYLQNNFVLAWNSVAPAPKVTIDFGNGRTLERTIKGNTIFHLCRADGTVIDSLPGVYSKEDFLSELRASKPLAELSDEQVIENHRGYDELKLALAGVDLQALGKGAVEAPLVKAIEVDKTPTLGKQGIVDISAIGESFEKFEQKYLPGEGSLAERAIQADSASSLNVLRPAVRNWMGGLEQLPNLETARTTIYKDILDVKIDDPYLGLKVDGLPGTP